MATSKKSDFFESKIGKTQGLRTESFKSDSGVAGCFIENAGEVIQTFDDTFYDVTEEKVKIKGDDAINLIRLLWGKIEESYSECLGKQVEIEFGDSASANLLETVVKFIIKN